MDRLWHEDETRYRVYLTEDGHLPLPEEHRRALGVKPGDALVVTLENKELKVHSVQNALRRIQEELRGIVPPGVSLVDELLRERREEAAREEAESTYRGSAAD